MARTIDIPTTDDVFSLLPDLADNLREVARLRTERSEAFDARKVARAAVEKARTTDLRAAADVARGKRKTVKPTLPAASESLTEAERKFDALTIAVGDAEIDLRAAIEEHRETIKARLSVRIDESSEEALDATRRLSEVLTKRREVQALSSWIDSGDFAPGRFGNPQLSIRKPSSDPYRLSDVIPEIEAALAPTSPKAVS